MNNRKTFLPIPALLGALLLALVATMTPFVADPDRAYAQASANADLSNLTVVGAPSGTVYAGGDLAPTFGAAVTEYTVRTIHNDTGITVTAPADDTGATVRVNGVRTDATTNQAGVSIPPGATTNISIVVTAAAGNTKTYTVKAYRNRPTLSSNADLSSLSISPSGGLKESATSTSAAPVYEARVQSGKVTVDYTLSDRAGAASAVVAAGSGTSIDDTTKPKEITLTTEGVVGAFTVTVTPESGTGGNKVYTINVYRIRANPSPDATLSALGLAANAGNIVTTYTFAADTTTYDLTADNDVEYVTVAPTATDSTGGAQYVISPSDARAAVEGHQVNLAAGIDTTITVMVTAEDSAATQTYTVMIYKRRAATATNPAINDVTLSALSLSTGTLDPAFSSGTTSYSVQVADDVEKVTVSYTPTNNLGGATVAVTASDGTNNLAVSDSNEVTLGAAGLTSTITLTVTAEDGTVSSAPYTVAVYRLRVLPSADASLSVLTVTGGALLDLSPAFVANALSAETHKARAPFSDTNVTVVATAAAAATGATVEIMPADADTSATATGHQVALAAGAETTITVTVTAEDRATTATYTVVVYRVRDSQSDVATLSMLSLSDGMLSPVFMPDRMEYDARVGTGVGKVTVTAVETDDKGGVTVGVTNQGTTPATAGSACPADAGDEVTLNAAGTETIIHVCVTPENQTAGDTKVYAITVYRERSNLNDDADLSVFRIDDVNVATGVTAAAGEACGPNDARVACNLLTDSMPIVDYRVRTVSVVATASDMVGATVEVVSPADKNPATERHDIDLAPGAMTNIEVLVTAEDTSVTKTYTASVYRKGLTPSKDATLSDLMFDGATLVEMVDADTTMYTANAGFSTTQVTIMATPTDTAGGARVEYGSITGTAPFAMGTDADIDMDGWQVKLGAAGSETAVVVKVTPEAGPATPAATDDCIATGADANVKCYTITITRGATASDNAKLESLELMHGGETVSLLTAKYWWNSLDCPQMNAVMGSDQPDDMTSSFCAMYDDLGEEAKMQVDARFMMSVADAWNAIGCEDMNDVMEAHDQPDTMESRFCKMYADLGDMEKMEVYESYRPSSFSIMVANDVDMTNVTAEPQHFAATVAGTGTQALAVGMNTLTITVTAEDGTTTKDYTVMVDRAEEEPTTGNELLNRYDADDSGHIDLMEVSTAIDDFFDGNLTLEQVSAVIDLYFM